MMHLAESNPIPKVGLGMNLSLYNHRGSTQSTAFSGGGGGFDLNRIQTLSFKSFPSNSFLRVSLNLPQRI